MRQSPVMRPLAGTEVSGNLPPNPLVVKGSAAKLLTLKNYLLSSRFLSINFSLYRMPDACYTRNELIRRASVKVLDQKYSQEVSEAIALAIHPWPDTELSQDEIDEIIAEMLPRRNVNHHSTVEIAIDRLLRLASCFDNFGREELAAEYQAAANRLEEFKNGVAVPAKMDDVISNPIGLDPGALVESRETVEDGEESFANRRDLQLTVAQMFGAAESSGAFDLGQMFGGESTGVSIEQLAEHFDAENPLQMFDRFVDSLDSRDNDIFVSRICDLEKTNTLEDLAGQWGVSRERIRQREQKVVELADREIGEVFRRFCLPFAAQFKEKIIKAKFLLAGMMSLASGSKHQDAACGYAMFVSGPWRVFDAWVFNASVDNQVGSLEESFQSIRKENGAVSDDVFSPLVSDLFVNAKQQAEYLENVHDIVKVGAYWSKNSRRSLVATALRSLGRPSTKEEIASLLDVEIKRIGSYLSSIDGIVRADRFRWGFSEWIDDEYSGIVDEIKQRIDEEGGEVSVYRLLKEIPEKFNVTESSVRSYLASDAFCVEGGMVTISDGQGYIEREPSLVKGGVKRFDLWGQVLKLTLQHFEGYSLGVSFDLAFANGIRPNDSLLVPVDGTDQQGTIIWRPTSTNRRVDVGRVSDALSQLGFEPGDSVLVVTLPSKIRIEHIDEELLQIEEDDYGDEEDELIFSESECHDLLADVIPNERGDHE